MRNGTLFFARNSTVSSRRSNSWRLSGMATTSQPQSVAASRFVELTDSTSSAPARTANSTSVG